MFPEFLHIGNFTIYSYALCISVGTLIASIYTKRRAKKELGIKELSNTFFYMVFLAGFIGGKLFYYLERPSYFFENPSLMAKNFSSGFVFYGSFVCIIPFVIYYLKKQKISILPMLDILAIATLIVHSIGRLGCFLGGCCYGKPTELSIGIKFPKTYGTAVHPSQLYEITALLLIMGLLFYLKKRQTFKGQLFFVYIISYAFARICLEIFRGDNRGFIIDNLVSHSQFIGILLIVLTLFIYNHFKNKLLTQKTIL
ncbi:MAG: prolipoprotein diacylglyceryl transferase [Flavobacteriaceae bacterium]